MPPGLGSGLLAASIVLLVVLAPTVPDEPLHLSGVMVVAGLASAVLALAVGIAQGLGAKDARVRTRGRWVAGLAVLTILATLGALAAQVLSEVS
jgi:hypothetical protein